MIKLQQFPEGLENNQVYKELMNIHPSHWSGPVEPLEYIGKHP